MKEEPVNPQQPTEPVPATEPPAQETKPKKSKKRSRSERFFDAAQEVIDACNEADEALAPYVEGVNDAIRELGDAFDALTKQLEEVSPSVLDALTELQEVKAEYQDRYDNMSERAQEGELGQILSTLCDIDIEKDMPEVDDSDVPGEIEEIAFDEIRDAAQECLDAEAP